MARILGVTTPVAHRLTIREELPEGREYSEMLQNLRPLPPLTLLFLRVVNRREEVRRYVFDREDRLQVLEVLDSRKALVSRQIPSFRFADSKYLVSSLQGAAPGLTREFRIGYRSMGRLTVPVGFTSTSTASDLPCEVWVDFEKVRLQLGKSRE